MSKSNRGNKRPQTSKGRNENLMRAMQDKRKSNAAGPHRPKTDYRRKPKHGNNYDE